MTTFLSYIICVSSIIVITSRSPVTSVVYLISTFLLTTIYLSVQSMVYLGLTYTIVYVGGVIVLLLFVIMMMNLGLQSPSRFTQNLPLSIVVICIYTQIILNIDDIIRPSSVIDIFQSITSLLTVSDINQHNSMYNDLQISFSSTMSSISEATQIQSIGFELYTHQGIWLILISIVLMLSIVGPIVICQKKI